ncbi:hypothetical protein B0H16DRAFT_1481375 [Mycena metata]|uniref:Uncharacterized protein n=1 Tax=Mycena metata TaxID=1033252 RepID=A0AAD7MAT9_9AGAR|nr:hypothetical protein B0H16DRAFT_1481375 [Mycena metata]
MRSPPSVEGAYKRHMGLDNSASSTGVSTHAVAAKCAEMKNRIAHETNVRLHADQSSPASFEPVLADMRSLPSRKSGKKRAKLLTLLLIRIIFPFFRANYRGLGKPEDNLLLYYPNQLLKFTTPGVTKWFNARASLCGEVLADSPWTTDESHVHRVSIRAQAIKFLLGIQTYYVRND